MSSNSLNSQQPGLSLYQHSTLILEKLQYIPQLNDYLYTHSQSSSSEDENPERDNPVTILWNAFKKGIVLCELMNILSGEEIAPAITDIQTRNDAKKNIYKFMNAWQLVIVEPEIKLSFNINDLLGNDTNVMTKALSAVDIILDRMQRTETNTTNNRHNEPITREMVHEQSTSKIKRTGYTPSHFIHYKKN